MKKFSLIDNRNAKIRSRVTRNKKLRTETVGRDAGPEMAISTDSRSGQTRLFIDLNGSRDFGPSATESAVQLDGRQARTLFRLLAKHYGYTGKSFTPVSTTVSA